ncbi:zinc ribbon domain-containing protein [Flavobacterium daejeonense]|uniref:zinc ribbon domain-containing protein n=1 Tax=Flavobacterium daejeonense TaxID=350893 RepID=UPI00047EAA25|nr:zinc ribbon domain-containing protein [Flavobacterium daejeonense]
MKIICSNCENENESTSKYCSFCGFQLPLPEKENPQIEIKPTKTAKPKRKVDLKFAIAFAVSFIVMFFITKSFFEPSIDIQLSKIANEMNKTCPMNIDQFTILNNVEALPDNTLQYNYTINNITKEEVKLDTVKKYLFPSILQNVKTSPEMKSFRDNQVTLNYRYSDKNGLYITTYIVTPEMYEEE